MKIYFSHPTFTFKTKTEKECIDIIEEYLEPEDIIDPSDFGLKHDRKSELEKADAVVGMAVSYRLTYAVWKEMKMAKQEDAKLYTFMVENKENIGPLVKGVPENVKTLSKKESKKFSYEITKEDYQEGFMTSLIGSRGSRF